MTVTFAVKRRDQASNRVIDIVDMLDDLDDVEVGDYEFVEIAPEDVEPNTALGQKLNPGKSA